MILALSKRRADELDSMHKIKTKTQRHVWYYRQNAFYRPSLSSCWTGLEQWKIVPFYTISTIYWIWMCSLSGSFFFTYFRPWRSNANRSVDKLCNVARDQIINDICDNLVCQKYSKKSTKQQKRHLSLWFQRMVCSHLQENFGWSR